MVARPEPVRAESTSDSSRSRPRPRMPVLARPADSRRRGDDTPTPRRAAGRRRTPANRPESSRDRPTTMRAARRTAKGAGQPATLVIRDQLLAALHAALDAAGLPRAGRRHRARRRRSDPATATSPPTSRSSSPSRVGMPPRDVAAKIVVALEARAARPPRAGRDRGPGLPQPLPRADVAARRAARGGRRRASGYGHGHALAGQRINLEFVSANPTGPLHAGGGRWVAVGDAIANLLAAQGAEVHREYYLNDAGNQLDTFARVAATPATEGETPPEDGYQGAVPRRDGRRACAPSSATTSPRSRRASGATATSSRQLAGRPRAHRRALRHLVLRAHAARARRGRRRARRARRAAASSFEHDGATLAAHHRLRRPARPRAREVRRLHDLSLQRPRVPPRQVRARAGSTSSTSGAPTTTAR